MKAAAKSLAPLLFPLALVGAAVWLILEWRRSRQAGADPNAAPAEAPPPITLSDIGADVVAEDNDYKSVEAVLAAANARNLSVSLETADFSLEVNPLPPFASYSVPVTLRTQNLLPMFRTRKMLPATGWVTAEQRMPGKDYYLGGYGHNPGQNPVPLYYEK